MRAWVAGVSYLAANRWNRQHLPTSIACSRPFNWIEDVVPATKLKNFLCFLAKSKPTNVSLS